VLAVTDPRIANPTIYRRSPAREWIPALSWQ